MYADAASEVSEEVADGSFAEAAAGDGIANKEDLEEGRSRPANAASSARRRMLVPTDGGMVRRVYRICLPVNASMLHAALTPLMHDESVLSTYCPHQSRGHFPPS